MGEPKKNCTAIQNDFIKANSARLKLWCGLIWIVVLIYPVAGLFSMRANDICFDFLSVLGVVAIFVYRRDSSKSFVQLLKAYWPLWFAMSLFFLGELLNQIFVSGFKFSRLRLSFRFVLLPLFVYLFTCLSVAKLKRIEWGLVCSAFLSGIFIFIISDFGEFRPESRHYVGIALIPFTNLIVLTGFLAFLTQGWNDEKNKVIFFVKSLALIFVIWGAYLSETRASWVAILIFGVLTLCLFFRKNKKITLIAISLFLIAIFYFSLQEGGKLTRRINDFKTDISHYESGENKDTSIGQRFQLYKTSWIVCSENFWFGINKKESSFKNEMNKKVETGLITYVAAGQPHAHNEFLQRMVLYGILGGVAVLFVFLAPFLYFFKHINSNDSTLKTIAYMGVVYNTGFLIFGLTDLIYQWRPTVQFYVVMLSVLLALLIKRKKRLISKRENFE